MKMVRITFLTVSALLIWVVGCEVSDPGSPYPNQPPTTSLTRAPLAGDTVNHYIQLRWAGNDADGFIAGFRLLVDGAEIAFTSATDTFYSFESTTDGGATLHTFSVIAVDNEGAADPSPPSSEFYTTNVAPTATFTTGSVPSDAEVGYGFRMVFEAIDDNRSLVWFSISVGDEESWSEWSVDSTFLIADLSLGEFPAGTVPVSNAGLTDGPVTIYGRVKDAGDAVSASVSRTVNVNSGMVPAMNPTVEGTYGSEDFYPDGSIYRRNNVETQISVTASAVLYNGQIHSYRYLDASGEWSEWSEDPSLIFVDLPVGEYPFLFTARDIAGVSADTIEYSIRIVEQVFTDQIVIIDETRDGNGNPGSPEDAPVDEFYRSLVQGLNYVEIDYADPDRPGDNAYISPYDLREAGLVIWHADDFADQNLGDNQGILSEYLNKGGRLILSGWDVLAPFNSAGGDTAIFAGGSFAYEKLRIFEARYSGSGTSNRLTTGITGVGGFPDVNIDPTKIRDNWGGAIDRIWTFTQRGECIVGGNLNTVNQTEDPLYGQTTFYYYDQSFRVVVFGLPLYFCVESEVVALFEVLMPRMMSGL